jgi:hypothetical protein
MSGKSHSTGSAFFMEAEIEQLTVDNPREAFVVRKRLV